MMVNRAKQKGTRWENDLVNLLKEKIHGASAKKIAGSGALGTTLEEPLLQGDVEAKFKGFPRSVRFEAKTGYGGEGQHLVKREWLNKIIKEANNSYSFPALACKFSGARKRDGVQYFIVLDFDTFCDIINYIGFLYTAAIVVDDENGI